MDVALIEHLGSEISGSAGLIFLIYVFRNAIKDFILKDQPSKSDIDELKEEFEKIIEDKENYLHTLDKRTQTLSNQLSEIKGRLDATQ